MAFPGTYNFNYYRGDTFQFIIRPKDGSGNAYSLSGFSAEMKIAATRGSAGGSSQKTATAVVNAVDNIVTCSIPSSVGRTLTTDNTWVYDVQITDGSSIYTLLTGDITVKDDVTGAA